MITSRITEESIFIHAEMHDGSHEWVLIGGIQNTMQRALLWSPLLRFTVWY